MNSKLVLRQVPPEYQGEWLLEDLKAMEGFIIHGNREFISIDVLNTYGLTDGGDMIGLENLIEDFDNAMNYNEETFEDDWRDILKYYVRTELDDEKMLAIKEAILEYFDMEWSDDNLIETLIKIIKIIDGRKLETIEIHGCCQREWQDVLYDPELVGPQLIEGYYFNTGTEWEIGHVEYEDDEEVDFETVELDFGFHYTLEWSDDRIRKEFADCYHIDEEDIIMLEFDGYIKVPRYKIV